MELIKVNLLHKIRFRLLFVHHNGTIRTFRVVLFILVRICCITSQYNGTIRTRIVKQIPRTVVPGICFVRVIVIDFNFVFVDYDCKFFI